MDDQKCKMQNEGIAFGNHFKYVGGADTAILHFALYTLH